MLPDKSVYLRYQFPIDSTCCESPLLQREETQWLSLKSTHCCTLAPGHSLDSSIPSVVPGLTIWLCRNQERSETHILGRGVLSSEELLDLASSGGKVTRTICLYADQNRSINSFHSELIGKVRCVVRHSREWTDEEPGISSIADRLTSTETQIERENVLTLFVTSATDLERGLAYYKDSRGLVLSRDMETYVRICLFPDSRELADRFGREMRTREVSWARRIDFTQRFQVHLTLSDALIAYFQKKSALVELIVISEQEEIVFGSASISLSALLLNAVKGEFALMNEYGQYMGSIILSLCLTKEDVRAAAALPQLSSMSREETKEQSVDSRTGSDPLTVSFSPSISCSQSLLKLLITFESATRLSQTISGLDPTPYLRLIWQGEEIATSAAIAHTRNPHWGFSVSLPLSPSAIPTLRSESLIVKCLHKRVESREDELLGKAVIDLSPLVQPGFRGELAGWYHFSLRGAPAGQLKVCISPSSPLCPATQLTIEEPKIASWYQSQLEGKMKDLDAKLASTRDQELFAIHTQKMRDLGDVTEYLTKKFDHVSVPGTHTINRSDMQEASLKAIEEVSEASMTHF